jgi:hypothetical protein
MTFSCYWPPEIIPTAWCAGANKAIRIPFRDAVITAIAPPTVAP